MNLPTRLLTTVVGCLAYSSCVSGHIFFESPEARTCFYGGYWGLNGDGPYRREPCDRIPNTPTATYVAGSSICLSLHEFVAHPAHYDIQLFTSPIGPGDSDEGGVFLAQNIQDPAPDDETGYQRFMVDLPSDTTCQGSGSSCTIQVRQYVYDFDWYYYACVDVEILPNSTTVNDDIISITPTLPQDQCVWEPAPGRVRAQILKSMVLGSALLVDAILILCWAGWVWNGLRKNKNTITSGATTDPEVPEKEIESDNDNQKDKTSQSCWQKFKEQSRKPTQKRILYAIFVWIAISSIAVGIVLVGLKACWFGS